MIAKLKNKWENLSIIKKIAIITLIFLMVLILLNLNNPVFSESTKTFDWKHPFKSLGDMALTNICDEIFSSLIQATAGAFVTIYDFLMNIAINPFADLTEHTLESSVNNLITAPFGTIRNFFVGVGWFLATLIYFFSMFCYFFSGKITDSKDTPISLTAKYILVAAALIKNDEIIETLEGLTSSLYKNYCEWGISGLGAIGTITGKEGSYKGLFDFIGDNKLKMLGYTFTVANPGILFLVLIAGIVFFFKILKALAKLYCEMVSRYVVTAVFVWTFGAFAGTLVSNNTSNIFSSYLRTLFSSMFLLLFDALWFKVCVLFALNKILVPAQVFDIISYILILELCKFGTKFDGMLRSMGIGVATGMSRIGSSCGGSLRNLGRTFDTANRARKAGGETLKAAAPGLNAPASTQEKVYNMGSKLSGSMADYVGNKNDPNPKFVEAAEFGAKGQEVPSGWNFTPEDSANIIGRSILNPDSKQCQDALRGLGDERLKEGAQAIMGNNFKVEDAMVASYKGSDGKTHTGIAVAGSYADGINTSKTLVSQKVGGGKGVEGMEGVGVTSNNSLLKGQSATFKNGEELRNLVGDKAADAYANGNGKYESGCSVEYTGKDAAGKDSFRFRDSAGNVEGAVSGETYTKSASSLSGEEQKSMTEQFSHELGDRGFNVVSDENGKSWANDANDPSKWHAVVQATDDDGNGVGDKYNVTATNLGDNPTANPDVNNPNNFKSSYSTSEGNVDSYITFGAKVREQTESYGNRSSNDEWGKHGGGNGKGGTNPKKKKVIKTDDF